MLLTLFLLAAAPGQTAIDAERAFAAAAQKTGMWTAFRATATSDAVMFTPTTVNAQEFLKDRRDPPKAIEWWPVKSLISCDGRMAVNTGPFRQPNGTMGYFTTVWVKQADGGWKWVYDGGDVVPGMTLPDRANPVETLTAECGPPNSAMAKGDGKTSGTGQSPDQTLGYAWEVDARGGRVFSVTMWNGEESEEVLRNEIKPPRQP